MRKIFNWIRKNKEILLLAVVILLAAFWRFYKVEMTFVAGWDQGNHLLEPAKLIKEGKLIFQGPAALEKGEYKAFLGPFYYYLLAVPLLFSNLNVPWAGYFTGFLSLAAIIYGWYLAKKIFQTNFHAFFTAFFLSFSYMFMAMGRTFTNPFYLPIFLLILIDATWTISQEKRPKTIWWLLFGFSLSAVLQLHSSAFLLILPILLYLFIQKTFTGKNLRGWLIALAVFIIIYFPYIFYQLTNDFIDIKSYYGALFLARDSSAIDNTSLIFLVKRVIESFDVSFWSFFRIGTEGRHAAMTISWIITLGLLLLGNFWFKDKTKKSWYLFASLWVFLFLISAALFRFPLWAYYFLAVYPILFLVMADYLSLAVAKTKNLAWLLLVPAGYLIIINAGRPILEEITSGLNRAGHNPVVPQDLLYIDMDALAKYIDSDSEGRPVQLNFCYKYFYPGSLSYQPTYDFLLKYKYPVNWQDSADIVYFVRNPRDIDSCQPPENLKLIKSKDFTSIGVDKYQRIK